MKGKRDYVVSTKRGFALLVGCSLWVWTGCGDAHTFKTNAGHIDPGSVPSDHACFEGSAIQLVRYSSACERASQSLVSEVQHGTVFSADEIRTLGSPCAGGPSPAIEISADMNSHSLVFDFSQVTHSDHFPKADFEGYIFDITLEEHNGVLLAVTVDREASTLPFDGGDLEWDRSHIEVNLEGVAYDHHGLLKLDFVFARVSPLPG